MIFFSQSTTCKQFLQNSLQDLPEPFKQWLTTKYDTNQTTTENGPASFNNISQLLLKNPEGPVTLELLLLKTIIYNPQFKAPSPENNDPAYSNLTPAGQTAFLKIIIKTINALPTEFQSHFADAFYSQVTERITNHPSNKNLLKKLKDLTLKKAEYGEESSTPHKTKKKISDKLYALKLKHYEKLCIVFDADSSSDSASILLNYLNATPDRKFQVHCIMQHLSSQQKKIAGVCYVDDQDEKNTNLFFASMIEKVLEALIQGFTFHAKDLAALKTILKTFDTLTVKEMTDSPSSKNKITTMLGNVTKDEGMDPKILARLQKLCDGTSFGKILPPIPSTNTPQSNSLVFLKRPLHPGNYSPYDEQSSSHC